MPINNISRYVAKPTQMRKFVTHLNKAGVLLPIVLLETTVTGGRTYQAYKRGGGTEARERVCEESIGAVFWLGGVKAFNALGNIIGEKIFNIEDPKFSLDKDAVRKPFENMLRDKNLDARKRFLIGFKFTKIAVAVAAAAGILGFVVPKFNQKVTRTLLNANEKKKQKKEQQNNVQLQASKESSGIKNKLVAMSAANVSVDNFVDNLKTKKPSFGIGLSLDTFAKLTNNLENHDVYKLLATDSGVLAGRTYNARNKDERIEILVRDAGSVYFYIWCKDHVIKALSKFDGYRGKLSSLNPTAAMNTHNEILKYYEKNNVEGLNIETFKKAVKGSNPEQVKTYLSRFDFKKGDVIALQDFADMAVKAGVADSVENLPAKMLEKAKSMSKLQPQRNLSDLGYDKVGSLLTKQQVKDILSDSVVSDADFIKNLTKETLGVDVQNPYRFIASGTVEKLRKNVDDYVQVIVEYAQKNKLTEITPEILKKVNNMNFRRNALHIASGLGISALFLSTLIPKFQYFITKYRTGSDEFPGVKDVK